MGHEQAITGTPCDDPVPKKVSFKISVSLGGIVTYSIFFASVTMS